MGADLIRLQRHPEAVFLAEMMMVCMHYFNKEYLTFFVLSTHCLKIKG